MTGLSPAEYQGNDACGFDQSILLPVLTTVVPIVTLGVGCWWLGRGGRMLRTVRIPVQLSEEDLVVLGEKPNMYDVLLSAAGTRDSDLLRLNRAAQVISSRQYLEEATDKLPSSAPCCIPWSPRR